jgi:hypothetical protein
LCAGRTGQRAVDAGRRRSHVDAGDRFLYIYIRRLRDRVPLGDVVRGRTMFRAVVLLQSASRRPPTMTSLCWAGRRVRRVFRDTRDTPCATLLYDRRIRHRGSDAWPAP